MTLPLTLFTLLLALDQFHSDSPTDTETTPQTLTLGDEIERVELDQLDQLCPGFNDSFSGPWLRTAWVTVEDGYWLSKVHAAAYCGQILDLMEQGQDPWQRLDEHCAYISKLYPGFTDCNRLKPGQIVPVPLWSDLADLPRIPEFYRGMGEVEARTALNLAERTAALTDQPLDQVTLLWAGGTIKILRGYTDAAELANMVEALDTAGIENLQASVLTPCERPYATIDPQTHEITWNDTYCTNQE